MKCHEYASKRIVLVGVIHAILLSCAWQPQADIQAGRRWLGLALPR